MTSFRSSEGFLPEKLGIFSKVKKYLKILFKKKSQMINKNDEKKMGGCDDALLIYGVPKSSTIYVVK